MNLLEEKDISIKIKITMDEPNNQEDEYVEEEIEVYEVIAQ